MELVNWLRTVWDLSDLRKNWTLV